MLLRRGSESCLQPGGAGGRWRRALVLLGCAERQSWPGQMLLGEPSFLNSLVLPGRSEGDGADPSLVLPQGSCRRDLCCARAAIALQLQLWVCTAQRCWRGGGETSSSRAGGCPLCLPSLVLGRGDATLQLWGEGGADGRMDGHPSVLHQHRACQSPAALQQTRETSRGSACWGQAGDGSLCRVLLAGPKDGLGWLVVPRPLAPPGSSALKQSASSSQLKSRRFRGGERRPKLSPPAPTAREVHIGAGVVEVFL